MFRVGQEEIDAFTRVVNSGELFRIGSKNQEVDNFEKELAEKISVDYALFVTGGTTALIACLVGMGVGPGDEVIVPAYTFMASALAITAVGAIPVIVDVDETLMIDPKEIEKNISPHTKVIMPVHMLGYPCDMDSIMEIAERHNVYVLEDACQAVGGSYKGRRLGSIGKAGAFSFNYFKIISCGEGGAVLTNDRIVFERAVYLHDGGSTFRKDYVQLARDRQGGSYEEHEDFPIYERFITPVFAGIQARQSEINGAIMRVQLQRLDGILEDLRKVKRQIMDGVSGVSGLKFLKSNDPEGDCSTHLGFIFENEELARKFAIGKGVNGALPIDSGRHVYTNWDPIMNKRGAGHPDMNPFNMPANEGLKHNYSPDMCRRTLDLLSRTVNVPLNPDWTQETIQHKIDSIKEAARNL
ncbi:MAG TPA: DegT/DnrJ/EryC1/StrS family aminotransferase [Clostridiales bacterium]|nr:DegT/DnrJ/EryC1/StrS family aminotransferase [Clostridiales bacterium]